MSPSDSSIDPRASQRKRTRSAILGAAEELVGAGRVPSVADAAARAEVSRATAYRYFPSQGDLVAELVRGRARSAAEIEIEADEPIARAEEGIRAGHEVLDRSEPEMRGALRLALEQAAQRQAGEDEGPPIPRGGRLPVIEKILAPVEEALDEAAYARLRACLALLMGIETRVVLGDMMGLDREEQAEICAWAAKSLVKAALEEAGKA